MLLGRQREGEKSNPGGSSRSRDDQQALGASMRPTRPASVSFEVIVASLRRVRCKIGSIIGGRIGARRPCSALATIRGQARGRGGDSIGQRARIAPQPRTRAASDEATLSAERLPLSRHSDIWAGRATTSMPQPHSHPRSCDFNGGAAFSSAKLRFQRRSRILIREAAISTPEPNSHPRSCHFSSAAGFSFAKLPFQRRSRILVREAAISTPEPNSRPRSCHFNAEPTVRATRPELLPTGCSISVTKPGIPWGAYGANAEAAVSTKLLQRESWKLPFQRSSFNVKRASYGYVRACSARTDLGRLEAMLSGGDGVTAAEKIGQYPKESLAAHEATAPENLRLFQRSVRRLTLEVLRVENDSPGLRLAYHSAPPKPSPAQRSSFPESFCGLSLSPAAPAPWLEPLTSGR